MKRKKVDKVWWILALAPILIIGYLIFEAIYPSEDFYEQDFKEVTGIELTENAEFNFKSASYPDLQGSYTSVAIINIGTDFHKELPAKLIENGLSENSQRIGGTVMDNAEQELNGLEIEREFSKEQGNKFYYVALLSDEKTILVQRSSH